MLSDQKEIEMESQQPSAESGGTTGVRNMDILFALGILAVWFILQIWVLPKAGIST